jgi:hypothetical protein
MDSDLEEVVTLLLPRFGTEMESNDSLKGISKDFLIILITIFLRNSYVNTSRIRGSLTFTGNWSKQAMSNLRTVNPLNGARIHSGYLKAV